MKNAVIHICSFVDAEGSAIVRGKEWRWEFHEYLGPTFLRKNGDPLTRQPSGRHPVWDAFAKWLKEYDAAKKEKKSCC